jgi:putative intracellular protease/amidase
MLPIVKGRKVTRAHNIGSDVTNAGGNAGGEAILGDDGTADLVVDGNLRASTRQSSASSRKSSSRE